MIYAGDLFPHLNVMADYDSVKDRIITSVFEKRTDERYVAHLKIWEIENGNDKPRYIILAGECFYALAI